MVQELNSINAIQEPQCGKSNNEIVVKYKQSIAHFAYVHTDCLIREMTMYSLSHTKNLSDRTSSCIPIWFIFLWFLFSIVLPFAVYFFLSSQFQVHAVDVCNPIQFIEAWRLRIVIRCGCVIWAIDWSENSAWIHLIWLFMESRMLRSPAKPPLNHDYRLRIYRHCNLYTRVFVNMSLLSSFSHSHTLKHSHLCLSLILLSLRERERACILIEASSTTVFPFVSAFITSLECRCWVHYGFSFEITLASVHHIMLLHFRQAAQHSVMAFLHSLLFRRSLALSSIYRIRITSMAVYVVVYLCKNWILLAHVDPWAIPLLVNHTIKLNACTYQE